MSRSKKDAVGGHPGYGYRHCTRHSIKQTWKRERRRKHRAYGRIRIAQMLQMHEDFLEDRDWLERPMYADYQFFDEDTDDYDWRDWNDDYDRCPSCGRAYDFCYCDDHDGYSDSDFGADDWDYDYGSDYDYGYSAKPEPRYQVIDTYHDSAFIEGESLGDILAKVERLMR